MTSAIPIVHPLVLQTPSLTLFTVANGALAFICTLVLALMVVHRPARLARFAMIVAGALNALFQWPLALYSSQIELSLENASFFALCAHLPVLCFLAWVALVHRLEPSNVDDGDIVLRDLLWPTLAMTSLLGLFLLFMPYYCTAIYSMLFDPAYTLLAREVTIKLAGSTIATSAYGGVANAAAPAVAGLSVVLSLRALMSRKLGLMVICLFLFGASFGAVLIAGAKGLLVSLVIVVAFCAVGSFRKWWARVIALLLAACILVALLASFELLRERGGREIPYDFAGCVVELGTIEEGRELLQSMVNGGLTMSPEQVAHLLQQLEKRGGQTLAPLVPRRPPTVGRASTYIGALAYRAFATPIQGAAWHHLYVQEHGSPGVGTLPLSLKLFGHSVDITVLVYQAYGTIYSGGDATSTSTTPTSYFFAYSAYFGWIGLLAAIVATIIIDAVSAMSMRRTNRTLFALGAGLLAVIAYNAIASDLYTVMVSHGGAVALALIAASGVSQARRRRAVALN